MTKFDDLPDKIKAMACRAVGNFLGKNGYQHLAAASEALNLPVPKVWLKIMSDAGLPEIEAPTPSDIGATKRRIPIIGSIGSDDEQVRFYSPEAE